MQRNIHRAALNILLPGLISLLIISCRSQRPVSEERKPVVEDNNLTVISILENKNHDFHTLKARRIEVEFYMNGGSEKIKGNIAIYRDSLIAVSVIPALGYEVLRILCTRDSVIVINRPDKSYSATSFNYYQKKYKIPVDFIDLQAILSNEVFVYKEKSGDRVFEKQLNSDNNKNLYIIDAFRDGKRITNQRIELDGDEVKLDKVFVTDYETRMKMNLRYEDFDMDEEILFPKKISLDLIERNNTVKLEIRYGLVVFNDSISVEFVVPPNYTRKDI
jgi:hypothetical protein